MRLPGTLGGIILIAFLLFLIGYASSGPQNLKALEFAMSPKTIFNLVVTFADGLLLFGVVILILTALAPGGRGKPANTSSSSIIGVLLMSVAMIAIRTMNFGNRLQMGETLRPLAQNSEALGQLKDQQVLQTAGNLVTPIVTKITTVVWIIAIVSIPLAIIIMALRSSPPAQQDESSEFLRADVAALDQVLVTSISDLEAESDPRKAIIGCYVNLQQLVSERGMHIPPHYTPEEFLHKTLSEFPVPEAAVRTLTDCFRLARFSVHEVTETEKELTMSALKECREKLKEVNTSA